MDNHEDDLFQRLICDFKNTNKYVELSLSETEEIVTALNYRIHKLGKMGASKKYLCLLFKIKNKLQK